MAKIDVLTVLRNPAGEGLIDPAGKPITLRDVLVNALMANPPGDAPDAAEKLRRFDLARRASRALLAPGAGETLAAYVNLTAEEIATCKACIDRAYGALVMAPAWEALDPVDG